MKKENIKKYLEILGKWGGSSFSGLINYFFAKWTLILKGKKNKKIFSELLQALKQGNKDIVFQVVEILGKIGNVQAIPYLKEMLEEKDLWGITACSLGVALFRLGDKIGADFLKGLIVDPKVHRDTRLDATKALIQLKIKNVFGKEEKIDFGGETMTPEWSKKLESLVNKLRAK